jgi:hypothetical protein
MQELAAATAAKQLGQQLQQQIQHLEQDVEGLKQQATAHLSSNTDGQQAQLQQQFANQQAGMQQQLSLEAGVWKDHLQQQQELVSALSAEVRELQQQQQRTATPVMEALLNDLRQQAQQQIAHFGKQQVSWPVLNCICLPSRRSSTLRICAYAAAHNRHTNCFRQATRKLMPCMLPVRNGALLSVQEERMSLLLDDLREELLDRLDGLQLRVQVSMRAPCCRCAACLLQCCHCAARMP